MRRIALYILATLLTVSCSTTRYVPDGDRLYTGIKKVVFTDAKENAAGAVGKTAVSFFKQRFQIEGWERAGDWQQVQRILSYTLHTCLGTIVPNGTFDFDYSVAFRFASGIPLLSSTP